jgi:hypothetical protein
MEPLKKTCAKHNVACANIIGENYACNKVADIAWIDMRAR